MCHTLLKFNETIAEDLYRLQLTYLRRSLMETRWQYEQRLESDIKQSNSCSLVGTPVKSYLETQKHGNSILPALFTRHCFALLLRIPINGIWTIRAALPFLGRCQKICRNLKNALQSEVEAEIIRLATYFCLLNSFVD